MDASYFWQKAATCLQLAQTLSLANPARLSLLKMAESFERRARELETATVMQADASKRPTSPSLDAPAATE